MPITAEQYKQFKEKFTDQSTGALLQPVPVEAAVVPAPDAGANGAPQQEIVSAPNAVDRFVAKTPAHSAAGGALFGSPNRAMKGDRITEIATGAVLDPLSQTVAKEFKAAGVLPEATPETFNEAYQIVSDFVLGPLVDPKSKHKSEVVSAAREIQRTVPMLADFATSPMGAATILATHVPYVGKLASMGIVGHMGYSAYESAKKAMEEPNGENLGAAVRDIGLVTMAAFGFAPKAKAFRQRTGSIKKLASKVRRRAEGASQQGPPQGVSDLRAKHAAEAERLGLTAEEYVQVLQKDPAKLTEDMASIRQTLDATRAENVRIAESFPENTRLLREAREKLSEVETAPVSAKPRVEKLQKRIKDLESQRDSLALRRQKNTESLRGQERTERLIDAHRLRLEQFRTGTEALRRSGQEPAVPPPPASPPPPPPVRPPADVRVPENLPADLRTAVVELRMSPEAASREALLRGQRRGEEAAGVAPPPPAGLPAIVPAPSTVPPLGASGSRPVPRETSPAPRMLEAPRGPLEPTGMQETQLPGGGVLIRGSGFTPQAYDSALRYVSEKGRFTPQELAKEVGVKDIDAVRMIGRMEADGFIASESGVSLTSGARVTEADMGVIRGRFADRYRANARLRDLIRARRDGDSSAAAELSGTIRRTAEAEAAEPALPPVRRHIEDVTIPERQTIRAPEETPAAPEETPAAPSLGAVNATLERIRLSLGGEAPIVSAPAAKPPSRRAASPPARRRTKPEAAPVASTTATTEPAATITPVAAPPLRKAPAPRTSPPVVPEPTIVEAPPRSGSRPTAPQAISAGDRVLTGEGPGKVIDVSGGVASVRIDKLSGGGDVTIALSDPSLRRLDPTKKRRVPIDVRGGPLRAPREGWTVQIANEVREAEILPTIYKTEATAKRGAAAKNRKMEPWQKELGAKDWEVHKVGDKEFVVVNQGHSVAEMPSLNSFIVSKSKPFSAQRYNAARQVNPTGGDPRNTTVGKMLRGDILDWAETGDKFPIRIEIKNARGRVVDEVTIKSLDEFSADGGRSAAAQMVLASGKGTTANVVSVKDGTTMGRPRRLPRGKVTR